jgi:hypothetical protein
MKANADFAAPRSHLFRPSKARELLHHALASDARDAKELVRVLRSIQQLRRETVLLPTEVTPSDVAPRPRERDDDE